MVEGNVPVRRGLVRGGARMIGAERPARGRDFGVTGCAGAPAVQLRRPDVEARAHADEQECSGGLVVSHPETIARTRRRREQSLRDGIAVGVDLGAVGATLKPRRQITPGRCIEREIGDVGAGRDVERVAPQHRAARIDSRERRRRARTRESAVQHTELIVGRIPGHAWIPRPDTDIRDLERAVDQLCAHAENRAPDREVRRLPGDEKHVARRGIRHRRTGFLKGLAGDRGFSGHDSVRIRDDPRVHRIGEQSPVPRDEECAESSRAVAEIRAVDHPWEVCEQTAVVDLEGCGNRISRRVRKDTEQRRHRVAGGRPDDEIDVVHGIVCGIRSANGHRTEVGVRADPRQLRPCRRRRTQQTDQRRCRGSANQLCERRKSSAVAHRFTFDRENAAIRGVPVVPIGRNGGEQ